GGEYGDAAKVRGATTQHEARGEPANVGSLELLLNELERFLEAGLDNLADLTPRYRTAIARVERGDVDHPIVLEQFGQRVAVANLDLLRRGGPRAPSGCPGVAGPEATHRQGLRRREVT